MALTSSLAWGCKSGDVLGGSLDVCKVQYNLVLHHAAFVLIINHISKADFRVPRYDVAASCIKMPWSLADKDAYQRLPP
jgi:hypothetical protein